jgi:putative endonuclease
MSAEGSLRGARDALLRVRAARSKDGRWRRDHRRALGRYGQALALRYLLARDFKLLERNYRTRIGEIDLIVFDEYVLVFVEIKTRLVERSDGGGPVWKSPLEWLSASQLARLRSVAEAWLADERYATPAVEKMRLDAIGVLIDAKGSLLDLRHVEGGE